MKLDMHYLFTAKYAKWIIISLISLFSVLILVEWVSLIYSPKRLSMSAPTDKSTEIGGKQNSFDFILNSSLFGVYVPNDLNSVKKSMLNVTLVGIMLADNIDESQVIIRSASGDEQTYKIGDSIPGEALIKRITAGGVLVERNGVLESLSLPKNDLDFEPAAKPLTEE